MIQIVHAASQKRIGDARKLFIEYAHSLNVDLCFENLDKEVNELPGAYAPPHGSLLLAADGKQKQAEELLQEQAPQPSSTDSPNQT